MSTVLHASSKFSNYYCPILKLYTLSSYYNYRKWHVMGTQNTSRKCIPILFMPFFRRWSLCITLCMIWIHAGRKNVLLIEYETSWGFRRDGAVYLNLNKADTSHGPRKIECVESGYCLVINHDQTVKWIGGNLDMKCMPCFVFSARREWKTTIVNIIFVLISLRKGFYLRKRFRKQKWD